MQIDFGSSGGAASQELAYQVETHMLPEGLARELERLVESSGAFTLQQKDATPNVAVGRADVITYRLSLSEGTRHTSLWLNDITAPASIRPLLTRLQQLALAQQRK